MSAKAAVAGSNFCNFFIASSPTRLSLLSTSHQNNQYSSSAIDLCNRTLSSNLPGCIVIVLKLAGWSEALERSESIVISTCFERVINRQLVRLRCRMR